MEEGAALAKAGMRGWEEGFVSHPALYHPLPSP